MWQFRSYEKFSRQEHVATASAPVKFSLEGSCIKALLEDVYDGAERICVVEESEMEAKLHEPNGNLMESGQVVLSYAPSPLLIYRGMRLLTSEGSIAGFVAAVIVAADTQRATHLLLIRRCPQPQYQLISVQAIEEIAADYIRLRLPFCDVEGLPAWRNHC